MNYLIILGTMLACTSVFLYGLDGSLVTDKGFVMLCPVSTHEFKHLSISVIRKEPLVSRDAHCFIFFPLVTDSHIYSFCRIHHNLWGIVCENLEGLDNCQK